MNTEYQRKSLSAGIGFILVGNLITVMLRTAPVLLPICLILSTALIAYLCVRTARLIRNPDDLRHIDLLVCRWCWAPLLLPVSIFLTVAYSMEARGLDPNRLIFGYDMGWLIFQTAMEAGLVFSVAVLLSPPRLTLAPPRILWKIVSVPAVLIHGLYVLGSLTRGFGQAL